MNNFLKLELYSILAGIGVGMIFMFITAMHFTLIHFVNHKKTLDYFQLFLEIMEFFKNYLWLLLIPSMILGEIISIMGFSIIISLFFIKPLNKGIKYKRIYIDADVKCIRLYELYKFHLKLYDRSGLITSSLETNYSLAKFFSGVAISLMLAGIINYIVLADFLYKNSLCALLCVTLLNSYTLVLFISLIFMLIFQFIKSKRLKSCVSIKEPLFLNLISIILTIFTLICLLLLGDKVNANMDIFLFIQILYGILTPMASYASFFYFRRANQMLYVAYKSLKNRGNS